MPPILDWAFRLLSYILDVLFSMARHFKSTSTELTAPAIETYIAEHDNTPALHLLLCSLPRLLFKTWLDPLSFYFVECQKALGRGQPNQQANLSSTDRAVFQRLMHSLGAQAIPFPVLRRVLAEEPDLAAREAFAAANLVLDRTKEETEKEGEVQLDEGERKRRERKRIAIEKALLVDGRIPPEMVPAVKRLLTVSVPALKETVDLAKIYFSDLRTLGLLEDARSRHWREHERLKTWDVVRKDRVREKAKMKKCGRCGMRAEDLDMRKLANAQSAGGQGGSGGGWVLDDEGRRVPPFIGMAGRNCVCMNGWVVEPPADDTSGRDVVMR